MVQFPTSEDPQPSNRQGLSRRHFLTASLTGLIGFTLLQKAAFASEHRADEEGYRDIRNRYAVADLKLASEWMATSYEIPVRVPEELLLAGNTYADTLIALSMMAKGASLNELVESRPYHRWEQIARKVELDPQALPDPIRVLLPHGPEQSKAEVLHFLPDVYVGQVHDLSLNAFTPTMPDQDLVERYKLNHYELANIRRALDDPLGVPEELLLETGGRGGLVVGDWVVAGVLTHHKPLEISTVLSARQGQRLSWAEACMAFGMRSDVLTRGPLSAIYPVIAGMHHGTVLCGRRRQKFPEVLSLDYDLLHLNPDEVNALYPLLVRCYRLTLEEQAVLAQNSSELAEKGLMAALSRLARVDLVAILDLRRIGNSYRDIVSRYALDLTGQDGVKAVIDVREPKQVTS